MIAGLLSRPIARVIGGADTAFDPDTVANTTVWKASDASAFTLSGSDVAEWRASIGSGTFTIASNRPSRVGSGVSAYVLRDTGESLLFGSFPASSSPCVVIMICETPTVILDSPIIYMGNVGGLNGLRYTSDGIENIANIYTGVDPFYSSDCKLVPRTTLTMFVARVRDYNTLGIHINDEPVELNQRDLAGTTAVSFNNFGSVYNGIKIREMRIIDADVSDETLEQIKTALVERYSIPVATPFVQTFGDSHTAGLLAPSTDVPYVRTLRDSGVIVCNHGFNSTCAINNNTAKDFNDIADTYAVAKYAPYKVIINYGTNDCITASAGYGWTSWAQWKIDFKAEVQKFITAGTDPTDILFITPPYCTNPTLGGHLATVRTKILEIAQELGCHFFDWAQACIDAGYDTYTQSPGDELHGNTAVHALLDTPCADFAASTYITIYSQPVDTTKLVGQTATFEVETLGATTFQWQKQESGAGAWSNIGGATSASYTTGAIIAGDDTDKYRCVLNGTTNTDEVTLTVALGSATGGTVTEAGGYRIHTFTSNANFVVSGGSVLADYLIVAGGGAGAGQTGGGGGAGGVIQGTAVGVPAGTYAVVVGAGATGASNVTGADGSNSSFNSNSAIGGGGGGTNTIAGRTGGSGGGGSVGGAGGAPTTDQGCAGGTGRGDPNYAAGGGGGAGAVGETPGVGDTQGGDGGIGIQSSISGTPTYYGGGGGGGAFSGNVGGVGGNGGGGNGGHGSNNTPTNGTANTGGGGGGTGANGSANGGNGGSGIVIIRYPI